MVQLVCELVYGHFVPERHVPTPIITYSYCLRCTRTKRTTTIESVAKRLGREKENFSRI